MYQFKKLIFIVLFTISTLVIAGEAIDINSADKEILMTAKGIGEKRAAAIITYRDENGPFNSIDQLSDIKGISQNIVDDNREILVIKEMEKQQ